MLYSNLRKRTLSGWLKDNYANGFFSSLKLQKFLFFYEAVSKIKGEESDFKSLRGYQNGPVFSDVYGDNFYNKSKFIRGAEEAYAFNSDLINEDTARFSRFLVNILNEEELSELTHELDIWKVKEYDIDRGVRQVPLHEKDFSLADINLINSLREAYQPEYIDSVEVIEIGNKCFLINKEDIPKLTEDQQNVLITLSSDEGLDNPVYISISEDGVLLVD